MNEWKHPIHATIELILYSDRKTYVRTLSSKILTLFCLLNSGDFFFRRLFPSDGMIWSRTFQMIRFHLQKFLILINSFSILTSVQNPSNVLMNLERIYGHCCKVSTFHQLSDCLGKQLTIVYPGHVPGSRQWLELNSWLNGIHSNAYIADKYNCK